MLKREFPELTDVTVNSSPYAVEPYEKMGFAVSGPRDAKGGVISVPMAKKIR